MFEYGVGYESSVRTDWHIHVNAHRDIKYQDGFFSFCHYVPKPDGYNDPRNQVESAFTFGYPFGGTHALLKWAYWNNSRPIEKCNGEDVSSDGWVAFIDAAGSYDPSG